MVGCHHLEKSLELVVRIDTDESAKYFVLLLEFGDFLDQDVPFLFEAFDTFVERFGKVLQLSDGLPRVRGSEVDDDEGSGTNQDDKETSKVDSTGEINHHLCLDQESKHGVRGKYVRYRRCAPGVPCVGRTLSGDVHWMGMGGSSSDHVGVP